MTERVGRDERPWGRIILFASSGAAALHFAASGPHLMEYRLAGTFMIASGIAQLITGLWLARGAPRVLADITSIGNAALIGTWCWTRVSGLPFGPRAGMREDIHAQDALAVLLEIIIVVALFADARGARPGAHVTRILTKATGFGTALVVVAGAHDPARERLVGFAALALAGALHLCTSNARVINALGSIRRNDEEAARDRRLTRPVVVAAGAVPGTR